MSALAPREGLLDLQFGGQTISDARLMQMRNLDTLCEYDVPDLFVRGADLVVQYAAKRTDGVSCQVYWRAIESCEPQAVGVEVVVSVQTGLLDDTASILLGSEVPCREVLHLAEDGSPTLIAGDASRGPEALDRTTRIGQPGPLLYRMAEGLGSCVEMVHPSDFLAGQVAYPSLDGRGARSVFTLVDERLEKGVIRRARARTLLLPGEDDAVAAAECYRRFAASPSPLTV